jgi:hypothetical protein
MQRSKKELYGEKLYAATAALPAIRNILWAASMAGLVMIARRARPST